MHFLGQLLLQCSRIHCTKRSISVARVADQRCCKARESTVQYIIHVPGENTNCVTLAVLSDLKED